MFADRHRPGSLYTAAGQRKYLTAAERLRFLQAAKMSFGNDQHMGWSLGVDILEGICVFILVDFFRRNLAADDFAEQAASHTPIILAS